MDAEFLNVADLSALLRLKPETVRWYASQSPERLPPRVTWTGRALWARADVITWLAEHSVNKTRVEVDTTRLDLKRKGRPRRQVY